MPYSGYASATEVRDLLPKVITAVMGDTAIETKITDAARIIDARLGSRYTVPFSTSSVPPIINTIAKNIAAYFVMRTLFTKDGQNRSEWIDDYKATLKTLDELAKGNGSVLDASGNELTRSAEPLESTTAAYNPTFQMDEIEESKVDGNLLDDIATTRENT